MVGERVSLMRNLEVCTVSEIFGGTVSEIFGGAVSPR
jgi:hypothetical protein